MRLSMPAAWAAWRQALPDDIGRDRYVGTAVMHSSGEEVGLRFHPAPIDSKGFEQYRTQWYFTIMATLSLVNADHHALAVNVGDLESAQFGSAHGGGVESHEQGAVKQITGGIDEPSHFLWA